KAYNNGASEIALVTVAMERHGPGVIILTSTVWFLGQHAPRGAGRRHATSRFCRLPRLHPIPSRRHPRNSGLDSPPRCDKRCSENDIANGSQANLSVWPDRS